MTWIVDAPTTCRSDPIGPASVAVDVKQFLDYANSKAELWQGTSKTLIEAPFAALSANEKDALSERCSCEDLRNEAQAHWDDDALVTDLKLWQWARTYAGSDDNERLAQAVGDTPTAHKTIRSTSSGPAAKKRKGKKAEPEELLVGASDIVIDPSLQASRDIERSCTILNLNLVSSSCPAELTERALRSQTH